MGSLSRTTICPISDVDRNGDGDEGKGEGSEVALDVVHEDHLRQG